MLIKLFEKVRWNITGKRLPGPHFLFLRTNMSTKEVYEFCVLCGPEEDAPHDNDQWVQVLCRSCSYNEAHGWEHMDEMVNSENYH